MLGISIKEGKSLLWHRWAGWPT